MRRKKLIYIITKVDTILITRNQVFSTMKVSKLSGRCRCTLGRWKFTTRPIATVHRYAFSTPVGASFGAMRALRSKTLRLVSSGSYCPGGGDFPVTFTETRREKNARKPQAVPKKRGRKRRARRAGSKHVGDIANFTTRRAISRRTGARFHACSTKAREGERKRRVSPLGATRHRNGRGG